MRRTAAVAAVAVTTLAFSSPALAVELDPGTEPRTLFCFVGVGDRLMQISVSDAGVCPPAAPYPVRFVR